MMTDTAKVIRGDNGFLVQYKGVVIADEKSLSNSPEELAQAYNNGICYIEIENEFTNPEKYRDLAWGEGQAQPKFDNGRLKIVL